MNRLLSIEQVIFAWKYKLFGARIAPGVKIYRTVRIHQPFGVKLERGASISDYSVIWGAGGVTIGAGSLISTHCALVSITHDADATSKGKLYGQTLKKAPINIGKNVWIGANVTVMPGVNIGDNSIIGAGSVVTASIPANVVAIGSPARVARALTT
jgi:acetyltransferase-like isoleucine patch superfamily enzyme